MTITAVKLYRFRLKLNRPLVLKEATLDHREGLLVKVTDERGFVGWGEIAPLPGFSDESLMQAEIDAGRLREFVLGNEIPKELTQTDAGFETGLGQSDFVASVRFGFETALLRLMAAERMTTLAELLGSPVPCRVPVNALLSGSPETVLARARMLKEHGYPAFKVKIGELSVNDTTALIGEVRTVIGPAALLRLDLNRRWNIEQSLAFFEQIEFAAIDYVEEPGKNINQLRKIIKERGRCVAVALDESLMEIVPADLSRASGIKAVIIKPTLLGFERARNFAQAARKAGIQAVISSSFESSIGIHALASLAAVVNTNYDVPSGLDTLEWLAEDLVEEPVVVSGGAIRLSPDEHLMAGIREEKLEEISYE